MEMRQEIKAESEGVGRQLRSEMVQPTPSAYSNGSGVKAAGLKEFLKRRNSWRRARFKRELSVSEAGFVRETW